MIARDNISVFSLNFFGFDPVDLKTRVRMYSFTGQTCDALLDIEASLTHKNQDFERTAPCPEVRRTWFASNPVNAYVRMVTGLAQFFYSLRMVLPNIKT